MENSPKQGSLRWRQQRWLMDISIDALGIEFDQNRLGYYLGPVRDEQAPMEMAGLRGQVHKLADLTPIAAGMAERREVLAHTALDEGHPATASAHWYGAAQLWGLSTYPIWENNEQLLELHRRRNEAMLGWSAGADHHVEAVDIPFDGKALPAYFHLPPSYDGTPVPTVLATDGMDGGRENMVAQVGDEYLRRGLAVLAVDGPGQSEAATREIYTSADAWTRAGGAMVEWLHARPEVDNDRLVCTGISFGSYFMSLVAATQPGVFRGCAVMLPCFEPGAHTIFEEAAPSYKARHMWMAGLNTDEPAFDEMVQGYDLRDAISEMTTPWYIAGGAADELSPVGWVYELVRMTAGPSSALLYDDATHAMTGSPSVAMGPPWRTGTIDWIADCAHREPEEIKETGIRRVARNGQVREERTT